MKTLVYLGPGKKALEERPKPEISAPTEAIAKITRATIGGTDLHIFKDEVLTCQPGRIPGRRGFGVIDAVGNAVAMFRLGDRVRI